MAIKRELWRQKTYNMSKDFLTTVNTSPSNSSEDDGRHSMTYKCTRISRSSRPEMFLGNGVLKIYRKITGEHQCRSVISIKLLCNFIIITLRHGCSPVSLLHVVRDTSRQLLLYFGVGVWVARWLASQNWNLILEELVTLISWILHKIKPGDVVRRWSVKKVFLAASV